MTAPQDPAGGAPRSEPMHFGRSFHDTRLEDACPCVKAPCGLVDNVSDPTCDQHSATAGRTIRQMHPASQCPAGGARVVMPAREIASPLADPPEAVAAKYAALVERIVHGSRYTRNMTHDEIIEADALRELLREHLRYDCPDIDVADAVAYFTAGPGAPK